MPENTHFQSDDEPLFSKNEIREIRLAMSELMNDNEELRSRILVYEQMIKKREATLKHAERYIRVLEERLAESQFPNINLN
jgi:phage gp16-like protein